MAHDARGTPRALLLFRTNASATLDPLLRNWPTPSRSAETLLVTPDGDDVLYLNELRHRRGPGLSFRQPRPNVSLPAAQAVAGRVGRFDGADYRGVDVLADLRPVEGSEWFLVTKVDSSEILADARARALAVGTVVVLLIGLAVALTATSTVARRRPGSANSTWRSDRSARGRNAFAPPCTALAMR